MKELPRSVGESFEVIKNLPLEVSKAEILEMVGGFTPSSSWLSKISLNSVLTILGSAAVSSLLTFLVMKNSTITGRPENAIVYIDTTLVIDQAMIDTIHLDSVPVAERTTGNLKELDSLKKSPEPKPDDSNPAIKERLALDFSRGNDVPGSRDRVTTRSPKSDKTRQNEVNGKTVNLNTKLLKELKRRLLTFLKDRNDIKVNQHDWTVISIDNFELLAINGEEISQRNSSQLVHIINDYAINAYQGRKIIVAKSFIAVGDLDNRFSTFYGFRGSVQGKMGEIENALSQLSKSSDQ